MRRTMNYIEEPRSARWLFGSSAAGWIWLVARLWLGWQWLAAGWGKVFGGTITWRFWDWGNSAYSIVGDHNIGWIRGGTVMANGVPQKMAAGDAVAGFAAHASTLAEGQHPAVAFDWYANFLHWVRDSGHSVIGPVVSIGELLVGAALILGLFVGISAFLGALMNFSYVFAGTAGINPAMIGLSMLLIMAWRNAGWYGLDRFALPKLGTPWHPGEIFQRGKGPEPGG
ncbi:MAG: DoxX family protein [Actinomycetota bacterium]